MVAKTTPNAAQPKSRRRWYQYSMRTLMVVITLLCIGFAVVRPIWTVIERKMAILGSNGRVSATTLEDARKYGTWYLQMYPHAALDDKIPWFRRLLGDEAIFELSVPPSTSARECAHLQQIFPEARVETEIDPNLID